MKGAGIVASGAHERQQMALTERWRLEHAALWDQAVTHPFIRDLGAGTLPLATFQRYFLQDYVFLREFASLLALGVVRAPDFAAARRLAQFLAGVLEGEEALFRRAFRSWRLPPEAVPPQPAPATQAICDLMTRVARHGSFAEILTVLCATEGAYLEWATRLVQAGARPRRAVYRHWIEIHASDEFRALVRWMFTTLNAMTLAPEELRRAERLFRQTLRCEVAFCDQAYRA